MKVVFLNNSPTTDSVVKDNLEIRRVYYRSLSVILIALGVFASIIGVLVMIFDKIETGAIFTVIGVMLAAFTIFFYKNSAKSLQMKVVMLGVSSSMLEFNDEGILAHDIGESYEKDLKISYKLLDSAVETKTHLILRLITGDLIYGRKADVSEGDLEELLSMLRNKMGKKYQYK